MKIIKSLFLCFLSFQVNAEPSPIPLGWIGPLSGPVAFLVSDNLKAIKLAIIENQKIDGSIPVELFVEDDQYNSKNTIIQFRRLKNEKGVRVFWFSNYSAMMELAGETKVSGTTIINPIDNDETLTQLKGPYLLVAKKTDELAALISEDILKRKISQVSILHFKNDDFMPRLALMIEKLLSKAKIKTITEEYDKTTINFRPFFLNKKSSQSEAFVFLGYKELGEIIKQARISGLTQPIYLPSLSDTLTKLPAKISKGCRFTHFTEAEGNGTLAKEFIIRFKKEYRAVPQLPWAAMQAYDSAMMLLQSLRLLQNRTPTYAALLNEFIKFQPFEGVSGKILMNENGGTSGVRWALYEWNGSSSKKVTP